jgi:proteasome lid subunit RPN8/RPN11
MKSESRDVFIEASSFKAMIGSAIEVYNRETNGCLIGRKTVRELEGKKRRIVLIKEVCPFQTEKRTPSEVIHGNIAATKRFLRSMGSMKSAIIGGYHSHPYPYAPIGLSEDDITSIRDEIEMMEKLDHFDFGGKWLEILISLRKKDYVRPQKSGFSVFDLPKKIKCLIKTKEAGYHIIISAYWVDFTRRKARVKEVTVYVPWLAE